MRAKKESRGSVRLLVLCAGALFFCLTLLVREGALTLPGWESLAAFLLEEAVDPGLPLPESREALLLGRYAGTEEDESCEEKIAPLPPAEAVPLPAEPPPPEEEPLCALPTAGLLEAPETEAVMEEGPLLSPENETVRPEDLALYNDTSIPSISLGDYLGRGLPLGLSEQGPQILIMHTHGTEAYTMADGDNYTPSDPARTTEEAYNVIRVGEEMKQVFEEMGFSVLHDKTLYDYPSYTGSYARSLEGIKSVLEQNPSISVVLDVHRDALVDSEGNAIPVTTTLDGEEAAQVMLVVGTEDGGLTHPGWEDNLALAAEVQRQMMALSPDFPRAVNLRSQRFNQHMTPGSLLVEVGTSGNTLQQALRGARAFARAAGTVLLRQMEEENLAG